METEAERQLMAQATVQPIAKIGEGCLSRFDPAALTVEQGADFSAAAQLLVAVRDSYALAPSNASESSVPSNLDFEWSSNR